MDLHSIYPIIGQGDTSAKAQKFLDNLLVRTNFALKTRTALGWRGLHPAVKNGYGWTCKIKGRKGVYGIYLHNLVESDMGYKVQYKLAYFPMPEEETRILYALETAILPGQEDYMYYVRNFMCYPHFTKLFYIADIEFNLEKNLRESLKVSLRAQKYLTTISSEGIYNYQGGEKICLVEKGGIDQNLPSYELAFSFFEVLGATLTYNLSAAPTQVNYSTTLSHTWDNDTKNREPIEIHLNYGNQESHNRDSLRGSHTSLSCLHEANAKDSPFPKAQWWSCHLPLTNTGDKDIPKAIDRPQLIILTGFLGSGKTSFLKHFIEYHTQNNRFVAVIQNEIGQKGLDADLLEDKFGVVEIDEGCVCCSLAGQLRKGIYQVMQTYNPDVIILETTGLANPFNLLSDIEQVRDLVRFDSITTVVDAINVDRFIKESNIVSEQIKAADIILLNKVDLVDEHQLERIRNKIESLNKKALVLDCIKGDINPALIYVADKEQVSLEPSYRYHSNHIHEQIGSQKIDLNGSTSHSYFMGLMRNLPDGIFRCKGKVSFCDLEGAFIFQYVNGRFELEESVHSDIPDNYLVFIGKKRSLEKLEYSLFV